MPTVGYSQWLTINLKHGKRDVVTLLTYAYSISAYFPAFARFSPRMTDLLTAEATLAAILSEMNTRG